MELSDEVLGNQVISEVSTVMQDEEKVQKEYENKKLKQDQRLATQLSKQIESLEATINSSVNKIQTEVDKMSDGNENIAKVDVFKKDLMQLDEKIDCRFQSLYNQ